MSVFCGKNIVVCLTGSIAAYKVASWVSELVKMEAVVRVVMTPAAEKFVSPLTCEALSGHPVYCQMFGNTGGASMPHIELGAEADLVLVAPASANTLAKLACGLADNLVTTTVLCTRAPVLLFPAMNSKMYDHPATQANIERLRNLDYTVVEPGYGRLACNERGTGRLVDWDIAKERLSWPLSSQDFLGKKILVTAGGTREHIDPARFLGNRSSGKMGYAIARSARRRGAEVVLVSGPTHLQEPVGVQCIQVQSAQEMYDAVTGQAADCEIIIKAAAVSDFRPKKRLPDKAKKKDIDPCLELSPNKDIVHFLGQQKQPGQILVGFAAESRNLLENATRKLCSKNLDLIVANNICSVDSGFDTDTNQIVLIDKDGKRQLPLLSKEQTADRILDRIQEIQKN